MPSVFVLEHGRLWLVAQRGYAVVPDGIAVESGITGRAVTTRSSAARSRRAHGSRLRRRPSGRDLRARDPAALGSSRRSGSSTSNPSERCPTERPTRSGHSSERSAHRPRRFGRDELSTSRRSRVSSSTSAAFAIQPTSRLSRRRPFLAFCRWRRRRSSSGPSSARLRSSPPGRRRAARSLRSRPTSWTSRARERIRASSARCSSSGRRVVRASDRSSGSRCVPTRASSGRWWESAGSRRTSIRACWTPRPCSRRTSRRRSTPPSLCSANG